MCTFKLETQIQHIMLTNALPREQQNPRDTNQYMYLQLSYTITITVQKPRHTISVEQHEIFTVVFLYKLPLALKIGTFL